MKDWLKEAIDLYEKAGKEYFNPKLIPFLIWQNCISKACGESDKIIAYEEQTFI
ncbi:MAG: hypothetical protein QXI58_00750 [Candidatus Micrarchaeia archaeon]